MKNLNFAGISLAAVSHHLFVFKGVEKKTSENTYI